MNIATHIVGNAALVKLTDHEGKEVGLLEKETGRLFSLDGKYERTLMSEGSGYFSDADLLAKAGIHDPIELDRALSCAAANFDVTRRGVAIRKRLQLKDAGRRGEIKVLMDIGPADVHIPSAMPNVALGYSLDEGVADVAMPVVPAAKQSDKFWTWDKGNAFTPVAVGMGASGAGPNEVSPALSNTPYSALEYGLASYVPTEVEANADAPLVPYQAAVDMCMDKLRMAREFRAVSALTNTGSGGWNANNVLALSSGLQWNGGPSSDPIHDIQFIQDRTAKRVTRILMGGAVFRSLQRNSAVRQYHFAKSGAEALPNAEQLSRILELPPIVVAEMKYLNASGVMTYVWPSVAGASSAVVLIHEPAQNPPSNGRDNATGYTYRWTGASAPDGTVTGGFMVRSYYDPRRGGRGGRVVVVIHNDAEILTGPILGGLITGVLQ